MSIKLIEMKTRDVHDSNLGNGYLSVSVNSVSPVEINLSPDSNEDLVAGADYIITGYGYQIRGSKRSWYLVKKRSSVHWQRPSRCILRESLELRPGGKWPNESGGFLRRRGEWHSAFRLLENRLCGKGGSGSPGRRPLGRRGLTGRRVSRCQSGLREDAGLRKCNCGAQKEKCRKFRFHCVGWS